MSAGADGAEVGGGGGVTEEAEGAGAGAAGVEGSEAGAGRADVVGATVAGGAGGGGATEEAGDEGEGVGADVGRADAALLEVPAVGALAEAAALCLEAALLRAFSDALLAAADFTMVPRAELKAEELLPAFGMRSWLAVGFEDPPDVLATTAIAPTATRAVSVVPHVRALLEGRPLE